MRYALALAAAAALALAAGGAEAADLLSCKGDALVMPDQTNTPVELQLTVEGGLTAPGGVTYAWQRPEPPVAMTLQGLSGDTLSFHGLSAVKDGGVMVADAQLNRTTLALVLKVRRLGGQDEAITLETSCQRS